MTSSRAYIGLGLLFLCLVASACGSTVPVEELGRPGRRLMNYIPVKKTIDKNSLLLDFQAALPYIDLLKKKKAGIAFGPPGIPGQPSVPIPPVTPAVPAVPIPTPPTMPISGAVSGVGK